MGKGRAMGERAGGGGRRAGRAGGGGGAPPPPGGRGGAGGGGAGRGGNGHPGGVAGAPRGPRAPRARAAGGRRNRRRRFALRAVSPDGTAARNGLLRRKWQAWKVKGMFTSLYGKNVLQYIIGKLPEKITPPRAGSKEHRL